MVNTRLFIIEHSYLETYGTGCNNLHIKDFIQVFSMLYMVVWNELIVDLDFLLKTVEDCRHNGRKSCVAQLRAALLIKKLELMYFRFPFFAEKYFYKFGLNHWIELG